MTVGQGNRVHAVAADTRTPAHELHPTDPGWHGAVSIRPSARELAWLSTFLSVPAVAAVATFLVTRDPAGMVGIGVLGFALMVVLDLRRQRRRG